jgi:hypothetical protein
MTTLLIMVAVPLAVLFVALLYSAAHSNPTKTVAEALVRWLTILGWFATALAEGADEALHQYRERRWGPDEQPGCERYRPWPAQLAEPEDPKQIQRVPLLAQLKAWVS